MREARSEKNPHPRHIIKTPNIKKKGKNIKTIQKKKQVTYKGKPIRIKRWFLNADSKCMESMGKNESINLD
jgi:hypothetical protein